MPSLKNRSFLLHYSQKTRLLALLFSLFSPGEVRWNIPVYHIAASQRQHIWKDYEKDGQTKHRCALGILTNSGYLPLTFLSKTPHEHSNYSHQAVSHLLPSGRKYQRLSGDFQKQSPFVKHLDENEWINARSVQMHSPGTTVTRMPVKRERGTVHLASNKSRARGILRVSMWILELSIELPQWLHEPKKPFFSWRSQEMAKGKVPMPQNFSACSYIRLKLVSRGIRDRAGISWWDQLQIPGGQEFSYWKGLHVLRR